MSRVRIQDGLALQQVAPTALASGQPVQIGQLFGVATGTADATEPVVIETTGVFLLPKAAGEVFAPGVLVYWDDGAGVVTTGNEGNLLIGAATSEAQAGDATCEVRLNGISTAQEPFAPFLFVPDDAGLAALVPSLGAADDDRFILVADSGGRGPQLLSIQDGIPHTLIATAAMALFVPGLLLVFAIPAGADENALEKWGIADVTQRFPANKWAYANNTLSMPYTGYVRVHFGIALSASGPAVLTFMLQKWDQDSAQWLDFRSLLAQEVVPAIVPYTLAGYDAFAVEAGVLLRLVVRHDAINPRTLTTSKMALSFEYWFSVP